MVARVPTVSLSDQLCACGCGGCTAQTVRRGRPVPGSYNRYISSHSSRVRNGEGPNPSGLCQCGCGSATRIATRSKAERGEVKGQPIRYLVGHQNRKSPIDLRELETGCWEWLRGSSNGRAYDGSAPAYRVVYERLVGPIPKGHDLHHVCENPMCVNPEHLEALTPTEHAARHR